MYTSYWEIKLRNPSDNALLTGKDVDLYQDGAKVYDLSESDTVPGVYSHSTVLDGQYDLYAGGERIKQNIHISAKRNTDVAERFANAYSSLTLANSTAFADGFALDLSKTMTIDTGTLTADINVMKGGLISVSGSIDIDSNITAGRYQIFSGTVSFSNNKTPVVYPEWWGVTGDGSDDASAWGLMLASLADGQIVDVKKSTYVLSSGFDYDNVVINGNGSTFQITTQNSENGFGITGDNVTLKNLIIELTITGSPSHGGVQQPIVLGIFPTVGSVKNIIIENITIENGTPQQDGNGIAVFGSSHNITIRNIEVDGNNLLGRAFMAHWSVDNVGVEPTLHPYNISLENIYATNLFDSHVSSIIFLSSVYNISMRNINGYDIPYGLIVYSGDYSSANAQAFQQDLIGTGITLDGFSFDSCYRGFKITGEPVVSGDTLALPVSIRQGSITARGTVNDSALGSGNASGGLLERCQGVSVDQVSISGFYSGGIIASTEAHQNRFTNLRIYDNGGAGLYLSGSAPVPEDNSVFNSYFYNNGLRSGIASVEKSGIYVNNSERSKIQGCVFGVTGGIQNYGVRVTSSTVGVKIFDCYAAAAAYAGFSVGSSTDYGILYESHGNKAAAGVTLNGGVPGAFLNSVGLRRMSRSAAPTSGAWVVGEIIWSTTGSNLGWRCSVAGTPGTWVSF